MARSWRIVSSFIGSLLGGFLGGFLGNRSGHNRLTRLGTDDLSFSVAVAAHQGAVKLHDEVAADAQPDGLVIESTFSLVGGLLKGAHLRLKRFELLISEVNVLYGHI